MKPNKQDKQSSRRGFLKGTAGGLIGTALGGSVEALSLPDDLSPSPQQADADLKPVDLLPTNVTRTWLGPSYWANRLQDWRLHDGRLECLAGDAGDEVRTVAVLTREIIAGNKPAHLSVRAGFLSDGERGGFCGFLIGAGGGDLDYRAAALAQKASGIGGGLMLACESDGRLRLRDHTDEEQPLACAEAPPPESRAGWLTANDEVLLRLDILPQGQGVFSLEFSARDSRSGKQLASLINRGVPEAKLLGGIALVSSPYTGKTGARYWFRDLRTGGEKIAARPERALGPILGTLYSLNSKALKLSAQLMPVGESESQTAKLQYRQAGGAWQDGPTATLAPGFTALFRMENWDATRNWEYRVAYPADAPRPDYYTGVIRQDPVKAEALAIALFSCIIASARTLEGGVGRPELPQAELLGRYTNRNLYFPHRELVRHANHHGADLLVFAGDQFYEGSPTRKDNSPAPTLDYLYKWYLWVWAFREMTRNTPAIVMVDDHDVYHGNIWGNGGRAAPERDQNRGGYRCTGEFINLVQRTQCSHNPDPYDPAPVLQGITVYYGAFRYGGVSFAILEDRKFKTTPMEGADLDVHEAELLGERQEKFLEAWAQDRADAAPKICLTQTLFASAQTSPAGRPLMDFDSNGYPKPRRDRAIELLREARALVLGGDQHLATIVRHGLDTFTDGVIQFTGPAAGSSWQRWFEPARRLPNAASTPNTGDFVDAFGNKLRVLAVANPKVTFKEYRQHRAGRNQGLGDRRLKSEGYGIIRVNRQAREFVLECWPWDIDPAATGARQFAGWPFRLPFSELDGRQL